MSVSQTRLSQVMEQNQVTEEEATAVLQRFADQFGLTPGQIESLVARGQVRTRLAELLSQRNLPDEILDEVRSFEKKREASRTTRFGRPDKKGGYIHNAQGGKAA